MGYTCNFDNAPPKLREAFYSLVGMRWRYWNEPWGTDTPGSFPSTETGCIVKIYFAAGVAAMRKPTVL